MNLNQVISDDFHAITVKKFNLFTKGVETEMFTLLNFFRQLCLCDNPCNELNISQVRNI